MTPGTSDQQVCLNFALKLCSVPHDTAGSTAICYNPLFGISQSWATSKNVIRGVRSQLLAGTLLSLVRQSPTRLGFQRSERQHLPTSQPQSWPPGHSLYSARPQREPEVKTPVISGLASYSRETHLIHVKYPLMSKRWRWTRTVHRMDKAKNHNQQTGTNKMPRH